MYLVYVDESGHREFNEKCSRYFVLAAVVVGEARWRSINTRLASTKRRHLGTRDVEIKSHWLRIPERRKEKYLNPLKIDNAALTAVSEAFYTVLTSLKVFAVAVDKLSFPRGTDNLTVNNLAYMALVELIAKFLEDTHSDEHAIFIHDLIQDKGGTAKGHQKEVAELHAFMQDMSKLMPSKMGDIVEDVHFASSAESNLLQLADLVAYNVWAQYEHYGDPCGKQENGSPVAKYKYFERIMPQFHRGRTGDMFKDGMKLVVTAPDLSGLYQHKEQLRVIADDLEVVEGAEDAEATE